jgi:lipoate-protein ligase A
VYYDDYPMNFAWINTAILNPADGLRFDEDLLDQSAAVLWTWESDRECVVMGNSSRPDRDVRVYACEQAKIPILKRSSGGGAVMLGPGCLNYSLILPLASEPRWRDVRYSLVWVVDRMRRALDLPDVQCEGDCDLAIGGRKVSGNAQRRTRTAILHHGTLLYAFNAMRAQRFLKPPHREPEYRRGRSHVEFLGNLPLKADEIRQRLVAVWC